MADAPSLNFVVGNDGKVVVWLAGNLVVSGTLVVPKDGRAMFNG